MDEILNNWRTLNLGLREKTEPEVKEMLDWELSHQRRLMVLERLHQRFTALRATRERLEIMREAKAL
jgi:hypothetical protein